MVQQRTTTETPEFQIRVGQEPPRRKEDPLSALLLNDPLSLAKDNTDKDRTPAELLAKFAADAARGQILGNTPSLIDTGADQRQQNSGYPSFADIANAWVALAAPAPTTSPPIFTWYVKPEVMGGRGFSGQNGPCVNCTGNKKRKTTGVLRINSGELPIDLASVIRLPRLVKAMRSRMPFK